MDLLLTIALALSNALLNFRFLPTVDGDDSTHVDLARAEVVLKELPRHDRVALDRR
ncbi:hypothetical protein QFZ42_004437 [Variovorax paradoxus]|uniref:hypothetical protein n=1 Tax=Variovorax paradoxus TaxID=34073 RepID=UPI002793CBBB|nr:hypothetical protein [Variovorax paradoxus]MDQ0572603.1 hypothetical protein [Variovorax paradoxus]